MKLHSFQIFPFFLLWVLIISISCNESSLKDAPFKKEKKINGRLTDFLAAQEYEFNLQKDPRTGRIPLGIRALELEQVKQIQLKQSKTTDINYYSFQGPENLGGRTRTIVYDVRYDGISNQTLFAGGVSGGVYKSTDNGANWTRKSPIGEHFSCTSIAQDPRPGHQNTWYYATGEALGNSASLGTTAFYLGNGVYKSTDNGENWSRLPNSNTSALETFSTNSDLISKLVVNPLNGDVYMACLAAIMRSQDGGLTWAPVISGSLGSTGQLTDVVISSSGRIYAALGGTNNSTVDGIWTSTSGNAGSWTRIAGTGVATNPPGWNAQNAYRRIVMALAPSNENILYAMYYNNQANPAIEADFFKYNFDTGIWEDRSANLPDEGTPAQNLAGNDPFAVQGGYDMVIAVKPDNENVVFIGGTNIYRSTDGFATASNTTRIGGYASHLNYAMYTNSHPDIHEIVFQPGSSSIMICGNDGGIQRTANAMAATVSWTPLNNGFRTFQYYYVAVDPRIGNHKVIGGAQDNGTTRNTGGEGTSMEMVWSGDGVSVGLSDLISGNTYEYVGSQLGSIYRRNSSSGLFNGTNIRPANATGSGLFVTLFHLDPDNTNYLYYANSNSLYKNTNAAAATTNNWTNMTGVASAVGANNITAIASTRGNYNSTVSSLFLGTGNAKVFRLDDPVNASAATAPIDISTGLPAAGYISSISVNPRNDDTVLVTFSSYGVTSIWWTGNANAASPTWMNVEGNLTLPSIRSSAIAVLPGSVQYFVGSSAGLFKATISSAAPGLTSWSQEGISEMGNAVVTSLSLRPSDNRLLAGTHGYGMWATTLSNVILPVSLTDFKGRLADDKVILDWNAQHDGNAGGFDIEKSPDGNNFKKIGRVNLSSGTGLSAYSFTDNEPWKGNNYYRLKIFDNTGSGKISKVILIRKDTRQHLYITNPFSQQLDLRFVERPSQVSITITDAAGKKLVERNYRNINGTYLMIGQLSQLPKGVYFLRADVDGKMYGYKLVKQ